MSDALKQAARQVLEAMRECRDLIQTDRTSLADSEMDPVTNTVPTDAKEILDEYDSTLAHAEDAVQLLTAALSHPEPEPEAWEVPQGWRLVPEEPTPEMVACGYNSQGEATRFACEEIYRAMLAAAPQPPAQAETKSEVENLIAECISGGSVCDPQEVADNIRRYCNAWPDPAQAAPQAGEAPSVEAAREMGAKGAPAVEAERLAFEGWMRGHCWALSATWDGKQYKSDAEAYGDLDPRAMATRRLWAAWRDRAALASQPMSREGMSHE